MAELQVQDKALSLEDRLNRLDNNIKQKLIEELVKKMVRPKDVLGDRRYLKDDLSPYIVGRLEQDGVNFGSGRGSYDFKEALYCSINKEPMKRSYWGQFNANATKEIIQELPPWAAFYFYAGIWTKKSTRFPHKKFFKNHLANQTIYRIVRDCVLEGIATIKKVHNQEWQKGEYEHRLTRVPHENEILLMLPEPKVMPYGQIKLPLLFSQKQIN